MEKTTKGDRRRKWKSKLSELQLIILQSEIREFGTRLYNKHKEDNS
tara:strand:+ start:985 stop:1122 length:138 start_codon:yes stop_codon:yes gene_type:complete